MSSGRGCGVMAAMLKSSIVSRSASAAAAGLLLLSLSACLMTPKIGIVDDCDIFSTITYSANLDTAETVSQVRRHNARYLALCGSKSATVLNLSNAI